MRVMILDDAADMRTIMKGIVSRYYPEAEFEIFADGDTALGKFDNNYDLIITDFQMPEMDGEKFAKEVRGLGYTGRLACCTGNPCGVSSKLFDHVVAKDCLSDFMEGLSEGAYDE